MGSAQEAEFTAFVLSTRSGLRRTAYLICGDWHHAEDVVQNALANVYARWARLCAADDPGAYVRKAVVNAAIDVRRRPWRRERSTDNVPDHAAPPTDELTVEVLAALAGLPRRQRAVVVLRYVEDVDVETTAALLGISSGTVKSQAAKGLAALRATLGAENGVLR